MASGRCTENVTGGFFAVDVKLDCPHISMLNSEQLHIDIQAKCVECFNVGENWICLTCSRVFCSRYINKHMVDHNEDTKHPVALSFMDASVWCYLCDSYIDSPFLQQICQSIALAKR